jgi:hypothetical protein
MPRRDPIVIDPSCIDPTGLARILVKWNHFAARIRAKSQFRQNNCMLARKKVTAITAIAVESG